MPEQSVPLVPFEAKIVLEAMEEARNYNRFLARLVMRFARGAETIMEYGAGQGDTSAAVAAAGAHVDCVEPDERLRQRLAARGRRVLDDLPPGRRYDFIYSINVLQQVERDDLQLRLLRRSLQPQGRLLLYLPAFPSLYSGFDRLVGNCRRYGRRQLCDRLSATGFRVEHVAYSDCLGFFAALGYKALGRRGGAPGRTALIAYDRLVFPVSHRLDRACGPFFGRNLVVTARPS